MNRNTQRRPRSPEEICIDTDFAVRAFFRKLERQPEGMRQRPQPVELWDTETSESYLGEGREDELETTINLHFHLKNTNDRSVLLELKQSLKDLVAKLDRE